MIVWVAMLLLAQGAGEISDSPEERTLCEDARTQMEMNTCAVREYDAADEALNGQWGETLALMRRLDGDGDIGDGQPGYVETLRAAQHAWLTYRDEHCRLSSYDARGGSLQPLLASDCMTSLTEARTAELSRLLSNQVSGEPKPVSEE